MDNILDQMASIYDKVSKKRGEPTLQEIQAQRKAEEEYLKRDEAIAKQQTEPSFSKWAMDAISEVDTSDPLKAVRSAAKAGYSRTKEAIEDSKLDKSTRKAAEEAEKSIRDTAANLIKKQRKEARDLVKAAKPEIVDKTRSILKNITDYSNRFAAVDELSKLSKEEQAEVMKLAPGVMQELGNDRGNLAMRALNAVWKGVNDTFVNPAFEIAGQVTGYGMTPEQVEQARFLEGLRQQDAAPVRADDPWYVSGPLGAAEMLPFAAVTSRLGGRFGNAGKAFGQGLGGSARAVSALEKAGQLSGVMAASLPTMYVGEYHALKDMGMEDGVALRATAALSGAIGSLVEGIVPDPFPSGNVSLKRGAVTAARQYLTEAIKKFPGELSEEGIQGLSSGFFQTMASWADENIEDRELSDAFKNGLEQSIDSALPLAFMMGVPAAGRAGMSAAAAQSYRWEMDEMARNMSPFQAQSSAIRLDILKSLKGKKFVSEEEAREIGVIGDTRRDRMSNLDEQIENLTRMMDVYTKSKEDAGEDPFPPDAIVTQSDATAGGMNADGMAAQEPQDLGGDAFGELGDPELKGESDEVRQQEQQDEQGPQQTGEVGEQVVEEGELQPQEEVGPQDEESRAAKLEQAAQLLEDAGEKEQASVLRAKAEEIRANAPAAQPEEAVGPAPTDAVDVPGDAEDTAIDQGRADDIFEQQRREREKRKAAAKKQDATPEDADKQAKRGQVPSVGQFVQWTSNGVDQFEEPRKVTRLSDDGQFVFVDGSGTGIPVGEVSVADSSAPPAPQVGEQVSLMGKKFKRSELIDDAENVRSELFEGEDGGGAIRMTDLDSGSTIQLKTFPSIAQARSEFETISGVKDSRKSTDPVDRGPSQADDRKAASEETSPGQAPGSDYENNLRKTASQEAKDWRKRARRAGGRNAKNKFSDFSQAVSSALKALGLKATDDLSPKAIQKAFRKAAGKAHPDAGGSAEQMAALNNAVDILSRIPATLELAKINLKKKADAAKAPQAVDKKEESETQEGDKHVSPEQHADKAADILREMESNQDRLKEEKKRLEGERLSNWLKAFAGNPRETTAAKDLYRKDFEKARQNGVPDDRLIEIVDHGTANGMFSEQEASDLKSRIKPSPASSGATKKTPEWVDFGNDSYGLKFDDPELGAAEATLRFDGDKSSVYVDMFSKSANAPPGSGKAILNRIVEKTKEYSPDFIEGHFTNKAALGAFGSAFGKENVRFTSRRTGKPVDIGFDAAMQNPDWYIARASLKSVDEPESKKEAGKAASQIERLEESGVKVGKTKKGWTVQGVPRLIGDALARENNGRRTSNGYYFKEDPTSTLESFADEIITEIREAAAAEASGNVRTRIGTLTPKTAAQYEAERASRVEMRMSEPRRIRETVSSIIDQFIPAHKRGGIRQVFKAAIRSSAKDASSIKGFDEIVQYVRDNPELALPGVRAGGDVDESALLEILSRGQEDLQAMQLEVEQEVDAELLEEINEAMLEWFEQNDQSWAEQMDIASEFQDIKDDASDQSPSDELAEDDIDAMADEILRRELEAEADSRKPKSPKRPTSGEKKPGSKKDKPASDKPKEKRSQKTKRKAKDTRQAARKALKDAMNDVRDRLTSGVDPVALGKIVKAALLYVRSDIQTFKGYIEAVVEDFGEVWARKYAPYLEAAWGALVRAGEVTDPAGKVSEYKVDYGTAEKPNRVTIGRYFESRFLDGASYKRITEARAEVADLLGGRIEPGTAAAKAVDEAIEQGIVRAARAIALENPEIQTPESKLERFDKLVDLYNRQPRLGVRTGTSMINQAYSTPAPLAYAAAILSDTSPDMVAYDSSAGNGMLLIGTDEDNAIANEIDKERARALRSLGFEVTREDGTSFRPDINPDRIIINPPFGDHLKTRWKIDGQIGEFVTEMIDHAISMNTLESLPEDGKAVLIIGSKGFEKGKPKSELERAGAYRNYASFYNVLYDNYNVTDHFTVSGEMYARQGASFPVDVIVIDGRGKSSLPKPNQINFENAVPRVINSWEELRDGAVRHLDTGTGRPIGLSTEVRDDNLRGLQDALEGEDTPTGRRPRRPREGDGAGPGLVPRTTAADNEPGGLRGDGGVPVDSVERTQPDGRGLPDEGATNENRGGAREPSEVDGAGGSLSPSDAETEFQVLYEKKSSLPGGGTLIPRTQAEALRRAMDAVEDRYGNVDEFVARELGYDFDEMVKNQYFFAEQIDALALNIARHKEGKAFVLGDQTGVGKGRVAAGMIIYAMRQGLVPVYITYKPGLYADIYRDLTGIGQHSAANRFRALATNELKGDGIVTLPDGTLFHQPTEYVQAALDQVPESWSLGQGLSATVNVNYTVDKDGNPLGKTQTGRQRFRKVEERVEFDAIFTTYDQMRTQKGKLMARHIALQKLAPNAFFILDESHNAGGQETEGQAREDDPEKLSAAMLIRDFLEVAQGAAFLSATYAKRVQVMGLYAKTGMADAVDGDSTKLMETLAKGGIPLQQVLSEMMVEAGAYMRRERTYEGIDFSVNITKPNEESGRDKAREAADEAAALFTAINEFDAIKNDIVKGPEFQAWLIANGISSGTDSATGRIGVESTTFSSLMHNLVDQMLLGVKAEAVADEAIASIKRGESPVITLSNTLSAALDYYLLANPAEFGDEIDFGFDSMAGRYLERSRQVLVYRREPGGRNVGQQIRLPDAVLGRSGMLAYNKAKALVDSFASYIPASPIDYIRGKIEAAGYKVAEITGRKKMIKYTADAGQLSQGKMILVPRPDSEIGSRGQGATIRGFNVGAIDAILLNVAGSTGLSIHAAREFKNTRRRHMIIAQPDRNIDTFMQTLGRINRTGQIEQLPGMPKGSNLPRYTLLMSNIPAEIRPASVLIKKLSSLNANVTADAKGSVSFDVPDIMNRVGDSVVAEFLADNYEINRALDPAGRDLLVGTRRDGTPVVVPGIAKQATGQLARLPVAQQQEFWDEVARAFNEEIASLDALGKNPLKAAQIDLSAELLERTTIFEGDQDADSPFLQPAYADRFRVKKQGRPYTASEIQGILTEIYGRMPTHYEIVKWVEKQAPQIEGDANAAMKATEDRFRQTPGISESAVEIRMVPVKLSIRQRVRMVEASLRLMAPGRMVRVSEHGSDDPGVLGVVIASKPVNGKSHLPSGWSLTIALSSPDRSTRIPLSRIGARDGAVAGDVVVEPTGLTFGPGANEDWDNSSDAYEERIIGTGNILAAYSKLSTDDSQSLGSIVFFTDSTGVSQRGLLMPRTFSMERWQANRPAIFKTPEQVLEFLRMSSDHQVNSPDFAIQAIYSGGELVLRTPVSRARAGRYTTSQAIIDAAGTEFVSIGAAMQMKVRGAEAQENTLKEILKIGALSTGMNREVALGIIDAKPDTRAVDDIKKRVDGTGDVLWQTTSSDDQFYRQAADIALDAMDAGIDTYDAFMAMAVEAVGEKTAWKLGPYLQSAATSAKMDGVRSFKEVLKRPVVTIRQAKSLATSTFASVLTPEQMDLGEQIMEALQLGNLPGGRVGLAASGTPTPSAALSQTRMDIWATPDQEISSADTSINQDKLPASFKRIDWKPGTVNADIGGGRFDNATEMLAGLGVENVIYDPFNRSKEHNRSAVRKIAGGKADTATVNNVLNVIKEPAARMQVIRQAADAVGADGTAYFLIYEGDGSGNAKATSKGWQENRKAETYTGEIEAVFGNVTRKGNMLIASGATGVLAQTDMSGDAQLPLNQTSDVYGFGSAAEAFDQDQIEKNRKPGYKSREKLIEMSIDDFLSLAQDGKSDSKAAGVRGVRAAGDSFSSLPYLNVSKGRVTGHEGRHRAMALKAEGYTTMPVVLVSSEIRWSEQDNPSKFDYVKEWPTELRAQAGAKNEKFSIPFPVSREDAMVPYRRGPAQSQSQIDTPEFKRWFGDSKVVDADGKPLVVYHGTDNDFSVFENRGGKVTVLFSTFDVERKGFFFAKDKNLAIEYGSKLVPVYLSIQNPANFLDSKAWDEIRKGLISKGWNEKYLDRTDTWEMFDVDEANDGAKFIKDLKSLGYDGAIIEEPTYKDEDGNYGVSHVVFDNTQIKSATGNQGTFDPSNPSILYQQGKRWRSLARDVVQQKMGAKATSSQVLAMLRNNGVKEDEIFWSGLEELLGGEKTSVTKDQVLAAIDNGFRIEETMLPLPEGESLPGDGDDIGDDTTPEGALRWLRERGIWIEDNMAGEPEWYSNSLVDEQMDADDILNLPIDVQQRIAIVQQLDAQQQVEVADQVYRAPWRDARRRRQAKFESFTLPGGKNYKEIALYSPSIEPYDGETLQHFGAETSQRAIAWIRFNERIDTDGNKVMFLEEVQESDRHKDGRKKGYAKPRWTASERARLKELESPRPYPGLTQAEQEEYQSLLSKQESPGVPDSPFKKSWHMLAMKRAIQYAVENGFDRIAWTTGEQQSERYDLSKQIDELVYTKNSDGSYSIQALKNGNVENIPKLNQVKESELEGILGKSIAQKIIDGEGTLDSDSEYRKEARRNRYANHLFDENYEMLSQESMDRVDEMIEADDRAGIFQNLKGKSLRGVDLKIGGEGMESFYDSVLINDTNKLIKKFGGKVDTTRLPKMIVGGRRAPQGGTLQPSFEITPSMRESALAKGQPLFQGQSENIKGWTKFVSATQALIGATDKGDFSTFIHEMFHPIRRFLLNRDIPLERRQGITDEMLDALEKYAGVKDGVWDTRAEEKAARAWEIYWLEGRAPTEMLRKLFEKVAQWMRGIYKGFKATEGSKLPPEIRRLFDMIVQRGAPTGYEPGPEFDQPGAPPPDSPSHPENFTRVEPDRHELTALAKQVMNDLRELASIDEIPATRPENVRQWLEQAEITLAMDPNAAIRLYRDIVNNSGRAIDHHEAALLSLHYRRLANEAENAVIEAIEANESGDPERIARARSEMIRTRSPMTEFEELTYASKSTWGRTGVMLQVMLRRDFSYAGLMRRARQANLGKPLTEEQEEKIREIAEKNKKLQDELDKVRAEKDRERAEIESKKQHDDVVSKTPRKKKPADRPSSAVNSIWDKFAEVTGFNLLFQSEESPYDSVAKGYRDLGVTSFGELMRHVSQRLGDDKANELRREFLQAWRNTSPHASSPSAVNLGDAAELTRKARRIQRDLVEAGFRDRDEIIELVREEMSMETWMEFTTIDAMDALSRYGQYSLPSEDKIDSIVRQMNAETLKLRQIIQLERAISRAESIRRSNPGMTDEQIGDMLISEGMMVKPTGPQREKPDAVLRDLQRKYNALKADVPVSTEGREGMLQSALGAIERANQNRIEDLRRAIENNEEIVRRKSDPKTNKRIEEQRAELAVLIKEYREKFPPKGLSEEQRIRNAIKAAERSIKLLQDKIENRDFDSPARRKLRSPELDAVRAEQASLRAQIDALKALEISKWESEGGSMAPDPREAAARKSRLANIYRRIAEYKRIVAEKDFAPKPRFKPVLSKEEIDAAKKLHDAKREALEAIARFHLDNLKGLEWTVDKVKEFMHLSRAMKTSLDASALLNQGALVAVARPKLAARVFRDVAMSLVRNSDRGDLLKGKTLSFEDLKSILPSIDSARAEFELMEQLTSGEWGEFRLRAGLHLATTDQEITKQEEMFQGRWGKFFPGVALSGRVYTMMVNQLRADLFDIMANSLSIGGTPTLAEAKLLAHYVNIATGRSDLKGVPGLDWLEKQSEILNMAFFAARFTISRFQYLAMAGYLPFTGGGITKNWNAKMAIYKEMGWTLAGFATINAVMALIGVLFYDDDDPDRPTVEVWDSTSSDYWKVKIGDTRIDFGGGIMQTIVFANRMIQGRIGENEFGDTSNPTKTNRLTLTLKFLRQKLAPVPGFGVTGLNDWQDAVGNRQDRLFGIKALKVHPAIGTFSDLFVPLSGQNILDSVQDHGFGKGGILATLSFLGARVSTYGEKTDYINADDAEREELRKKYLDRMKWDSKDPGFTEFLTPEEWSKVEERRMALRQKLVSNALSVPVRDNFKEEEDYLKAMERKQKAVDDVRRAGIGQEEMRELLLGYWRRNYGSPYQTVRGRIRVKDAVIDRLREINNVAGGVPAEDD